MYTYLGQFSNQNNSTECRPCEIGHYQNLKGQKGCVACSIGTFCNSTGCKTCDNCNAGEEATMEGQTDCSPCKQGSYKPFKSPDLCIQCASGFYSLINGSKKCDECPSGYYCSCAYCKPQKCPKQSICPAGSATFIECSEPFYHVSDPTTCTRSVQFYVLIIGLITAAALVAALIFYTYNKRRKIRKRSTLESTPILFKKKDPIYGGY